MSVTWTPREPAPDMPPIPAWRWPLIALRGGLLFIILVIGVVLTVLLRLLEQPIYGAHRPLTPFVTVAVCRVALVIIGLRVSREGTVMRQRGAIVANHASWLDIFVLNARKRVYFVSKAEVADWPGIGILARITGTVFIARDRTKARAHLTLFEERLIAGHKLLFFPEGTSTDGMRVLPFKTTLFQSFLNQDLRDEIYIQPVTIAYFAPRSRDPRFYGWWGDMEFAVHLLQILAAPRQGRVKITHHPPVKVSEFQDRKALAHALEARVRAGLPAARRRSA